MQKLKEKQSIYASSYGKFKIEGAAATWSKGKILLDGQYRFVHLYIRKIKP